MHVRREADGALPSRREAAAGQGRWGLAPSVARYCGGEGPANGGGGGSALETPALGEEQASAVEKWRRCRGKRRKKDDGGEGRTSAGKGGWRWGVADGHTGGWRVKPNRGREGEQGCRRIKPHFWFLLFLSTALVLLNGSSQ
jgi:hypothetical protein